MPVIYAIVIYAALFLTGTAISKVAPPAKPTPSPTIQSTPSPTTQISPSQSTTATTTPTKQIRVTYKVTKVVDGDTINVLVDGKSRPVRLIGIDTPETVDPRKPVQCFGKEASDKTKELLTGKNVALEADPTQGDTDKYNRLLRFVFLEDGTHINKLLISEGYAHEYTYQSNPYKYQAEFIQAQIQARENKKGLWADNVCITPTVTSQISTPKPTTSQVITIQPTVYTPPIIQQTTKPSSSGFSCSCSKVCDAMASCAEAYFQLNECGCSKRDGDSDGVPCESICPGG